MKDQCEQGDACQPQEGLKEEMEEARRVSLLFKGKIRDTLDDDLKEFSDNPHVNYTNLLLIQLCRNTGGNR